MMGQLDGRVVLVTGGARGIGSATVRRFVAEGASVVVGDTREGPGQRLADELGASAAYVRLDVASDQDWADALDSTISRFGKLDGLVNNAGIFEWCKLRDHPRDVYERIISVNQTGVFLGMRAVVPHMEVAGGGTIVNVSARAGLMGVSKAIAYTASKFAVTGMTRSAAIELQDLGIRVNSVHPGFVRTPLTQGSEETGEIGTEPRAGNDGASPEQIASVILFLSSSESTHCNGAQFSVDGGAGAGTHGPSDAELAG